MNLGGLGMPMLARVVLMHIGVNPIAVLGAAAVLDQRQGTAT